jgi:hypothetical protein
MKSPRRAIEKHEHWRGVSRFFALIAAPVLVFGLATAAGAAPDGIAARARANGFSACQKELENLERNLFNNSDYSARVFFAEKVPSTQPFSAMVDARRAASGGGYTRTLTHLTVMPDAKRQACSISYEQTQYHDMRCDRVQMQMAPKAMPAPTTSLGAVMLELHRNMTLTLIPVGTEQCVTVLKEVSY